MVKDRTAVGNKWFRCLQRSHDKVTSSGNSTILLHFQRRKSREYPNNREWNQHLSFRAYFAEESQPTRRPSLHPQVRAVRSVSTKNPSATFCHAEQRPWLSFLSIAGQRPCLCFVMLSEGLGFRFTKGKDESK